MPMMAAVRTAAFWQINLANALLSTVVTALVAHLAVHLREVGFSLSFAALMVASVTFASTAGLLFAGAIGDRVGKRFVTALAAVAHTVAVAMLAVTDAAGVVIAAVLVHGFASLWLAGHLDESVTSTSAEQATAAALGAFGSTLFAAAGLEP
jgi:MFS family permease